MPPQAITVYGLLPTFPHIHPSFIFGRIAQHSRDSSVSIIIYVTCRPHGSIFAERHVLYLLSSHFGSKIMQKIVMLVEILGQCY